MSSSWCEWWYRWTSKLTKLTFTMTLSCIHTNWPFWLLSLGSADWAHLSQRGHLNGHTRHKANQPKQRLQSNLTHLKCLHTDLPNFSQCWSNKGLSIYVKMDEIVSFWCEYYLYHPSHPSHPCICTIHPIRTIHPAILAIASNELCFACERI